MIKIGCHLSISKGFKGAYKEAIYIDGNTFQFFSRNPQGFKAKEWDEKDIDFILDKVNNENFIMPLCHAPYTLNPASDREEVRELAIQILKEDLAKLENLPGIFYNMHPGSYVKNTKEAGINYIVEALNSVMTENQKTIILLELMAGKGSEIGSKFEEMKYIIDHLKYKDKVGICLDTCHVFSAGYDIKERLDEVLDLFDEIIGLDRLKAIHLNDSLKGFGENKDRHAKIGEGLIGLEALVNVINHPKLKDLPFYLETPNDTLDGYKEEIQVLKEKYKY